MNNKTVSCFYFFWLNFQSLINVYVFDFWKAFELMSACQNIASLQNISWVSFSLLEM